MVPFARSLRSMILILILSLGGSRATGYSQEREPDVGFVPTPTEVVMEMLKMARVNANDIVYDLGCGDGRFVITAAKVFGARGVGIDIDPLRIQESAENARKAGVSDRVKFIQFDLFKAAIGEATVVALYLESDLNLKLRPKLFRELKPGTRIVSHEFDMDNWQPDDSGTVRNVELYYQAHDPSKRDTDYYFWVLPANVTGVWRSSLSTLAGKDDFTLRLTQQFQKIRGEVNRKGRKAAIGNARLAGDQISFTFNEDPQKQKGVMRFDGRISGDAIKGEVEVRGGPSAGKYNWTAKRGPERHF
jgi:SAM-dependent methyltransferase